MFGRKPENISVSVNDELSKVFHTTKEFKAYFKKECIKEFNDMMNKAEFEQELGCVKAVFTSMNEICTVEIWATYAY